MWLLWFYKSNGRFGSVKTNPPSPDFCMMFILNILYISLINSFFHHQQKYLLQYYVWKRSICALCAVGLAQWECPMCKEVFGNLLALKTHVHSHAIHGFYRCPHCNKVCFLTFLYLQFSSRLKLCWAKIKSFVCTMHIANFYVSYNREAKTCLISFTVSNFLIITLQLFFFCFAIIQSFE